MLATQPHSSESSGAADEAAHAEDAYGIAGALAVSSANGPAVMIVESPAKCATIAKFVGQDYVVLASYGHTQVAAADLVSAVGAVLENVDPEGGAIGGNGIGYMPIIGYIDCISGHIVYICS